jgi:catechol 2,3-dioxygenase-like lactoylglutathione lyase family enzyme
VTTISYWAAHLEAAQRWYTDFLGCDPYFQRPGYCEFRGGDYQHERGLIESKDARFDTQTRAPAGALVYWHVDAIHATFNRLLALGANELEAPTARGPGFSTAAVSDPFGNILGIMYNAHYLQMLGSAPQERDRRG